MIRVTEEVILGAPPEQGADATVPYRSSKPGEPGGADAASLKDAQKSHATGVVETIHECSLCGFTFSHDFIRVIDNKRVCPVCLDKKRVSSPPSPANVQ